MTRAALNPKPLSKAAQATQDEIAHLKRRVKELVSSWQYDIRERRKAEDRLARLSVIPEYLGLTHNAMARCRTGGIGIVDQGGEVLCCFDTMDEVAVWCLPFVLAERTRTAAQTSRSTHAETYSTYGT